VPIQEKKGDKESRSGGTPDKTASRRGPEENMMINNEESFVATETVARKGGD